MKVKNYFGKYINFSLISNCVIFNTLAGCNKKKGGKGCSGSEKDKDPVIINNGQQDKQQDQQQDDKKKQEEEEHKKREREEQEKADKLANENTEKLALENKKDGLKTELKKLKEALVSLKGVANKFFEINVFKIDSTEAEINNCNKTNIDSIEQKLNTDKTNFDKNLQFQFKVLKDKYTEIKTNNKGDKGDKKFSVEKIENIINKDKLDVNEFISLNSELVSYDGFVRNGLDGYRKTILEQYKEKDKYKNKFKLAKTINDTFVNNFDDLYNKVSNLANFDEIYSNAKTLNEQDEKANEIINKEKSRLDSEINVKKTEYKTLFSKYLLEKVKIKSKEFKSLDSYEFNKVEDLKNINSKLTELTDEINKINNDFVTFFTTEFSNILKTKKDFELIDIIENFFIIIKSDKYTKEISTKLSDAVKNYLNGKNIFADDIYIKLIKDKDKKTKLIKYNSYDSFVDKICIDLGNDKNIIGDISKYSAYYTFENFINNNDKKSGTDELKNIHIKYDDLIKDIGDNKSYVLFYIKKDEQYHLFLFISKDKSFSDFLKYTYIENITKFKVLENSKNIENLSCSFKNFENLQEIDLSNFDTTNVTNMESMFEGCESLKKINFHDTFNTSKVTTMEYMFRNCKNLQEIDLSNFDTKNVENMSYMFSECSSLKKIDCINKLDATNVINMGSMFENCKSLTNIDLSNFKTLKVTNMKSMFYGCTLLDQINLSETFNTKNVTDMEYMFRDCKSLTKIDLSKFDTTKVTNMSSMFYGCTLLVQINLSENFKTSNVNYMSYMFERCKNLKNLDLSSFDTSRVNSLSYMFSGCESLQKIIFSDKFIIKKGCNIDNMFKDCKKLEDINKEAKDKLIAKNKDIFKGTQIKCE